MYGAPDAERGMLDFIHLGHAALPKQPHNAVSTDVIHHSKTSSPLKRVMRAPSLVLRLPLPCTPAEDAFADAKVLVNLVVDGQIRF